MIGLRKLFGVLGMIVNECLSIREDPLIIFPINKPSIYYLFQALPDLSLCALPAASGK